MRTRQFSYLSILIFITISCKQDTKQLPLEYLPGYWNVYAAERSGKSTSLLNGAFFDLREGNVIVTNVNGDTLTSDYVFSKNTINVKELDKVFKIVNLSQDSMILHSKISNYNYKFYTVRSEQN